MDQRPGRQGHQDKIATWGYLIIFVAAALECAAFAGLVVPGESLVLALGAVPWTVAFVLLGYSLGASWRLAEAWIGHAGTVVAGAAILLAVLTWLWRRSAGRPRSDRLIT